MKKFILLLLVTLLGFSCKKTEEQKNDPKNNNGSITGKVILTDEFGNELSSDSGMIVTGINSTNSYSSTSDSIGNFFIEQIAPNVYDLFYTKNGFGTYKRFNVNVGSNNTTLSNTNYLGQISTTIITGLNAIFDSTNTLISFPNSISPTPINGQQRGVRLFFGNSLDVSDSVYKYTPPIFWTTNSSNGAITNFNLQELKDNGFNSGDSIWVVAYGEAIKTNTYIDKVSGKPVFPNLNKLNPSNKVGFVIP